MRFYILILVVLISTALWAENVAFLGISTKNIDSNNYQKYGIEDGYGVLVDYVVDGSAAHTAGIRKGMILRTFDDQFVYTRKQLSRMIINSKPGQKVNITVLDDGKEKNFKIKMGEKEKYSLPITPWIGVNLDDDIDIDGYDMNYGLIVTRVVDESPASQADIKVDDIILSINKENLYSQDQMLPMLKKYEPGEEVVLNIWRNGKNISRKLTLGEKPRNELDFFNIDNLFYGLDLLEGMDDLYDIWDSIGLPGKIHVLAYQDSSSKLLGVIVSEVDEDKKDQLDIDAGLLVEKVVSQTPAADGGIVSGDIILAINDKIIDEFDDISRIIESIEFDDKFSVKIKRNDQDITLKLTMQHVSQDTWEAYYEEVMENDIIKIFSGKNKPLDIYYDSFDDFDDDVNRRIELEIETEKSGSM